MEKNRAGRASLIVGAAALALTIGALALRSTPASPGEMRDAVAAPITPAALGGARAISDAGWFAGPAERRAEAERALTSRRTAKVSRTTRARAERLRREAARERALAVSAQ
jgi:hypothetical protein